MKHTEKKKAETTRSAAEQLRNEEKHLREEIEEYNRERDRIKMIIGRIGGKSYSKRDMIINIVFFGIIIVLFTLEVAFHLIPAFLSLEIGILLVSIKIIIMIHSQQKSNHFQFWVLSSIEYRINDLHKKIRDLENNIYENQRGNTEE